MTPLIFFYPLLLLFMVASALAESTGQFIVGLRPDRQLADHLSSLGNQIQVEQLLPQLNGYAISTPEDPDQDQHITDLIRSDPAVGFVTWRPRGFFLEEDIYETYDIDNETDEEGNHRSKATWAGLQYDDPAIVVTDDKVEKNSLSYSIQFDLGEAL